jgi:hypothetical protein
MPSEVAVNSKKPYSVTREEIRALLRPNSNIRSSGVQPTRGGSMKLTQEQKKVYIENTGNICPFCKSTDITGGSVNIEGREARQEVWCNECHGQWRDVYTLAFVEDIE